MGLPSTVDSIQKGVIMYHRIKRCLRGAGSIPSAAVLALIATCLLTGGCGNQEQEAPEIVRPVKMMVIGASTAGGVREYPGQVRAAEEIELSFEVPGRLIQLNAREGQMKAKGALIAALDPRDFEADRDRVVARRNETRADFERNRTLYERDAISLRDLEVVQRQFEVSEANLAQAKKALADTRLYAPFGGKVAERLVENRENVTAKQPIVVFHDDSSLEIRASFPESDFLRIRDLGTVEDMTARLSPTVEISAAAGRSIKAWVKELRGTADPVTRTYEVTLGFEPVADLSITSGMTARVVITLAATEGALLIPSSAVVSDSGHQSLVWVYDAAEGAVHGRKVELGQMTGIEIEILSGLEDGDTIAILGGSNLTEGMKVRPLGD